MLGYIDIYFKSKTHTIKQKLTNGMGLFKLKMCIDYIFDFHC